MTIPDDPATSLPAPVVPSFPARLYGRARELDSLSETFVEVSSGRGRVLLMPGHSGAGKTALARALREPVRQRNGVFLEGKFNQFDQDIPLRAFREVLGGLCRELLDAPPRDRAQWVGRLVEAVGHLGSLLTNLAPDLERLVGPQPKVQDISPFEAPHRFAAVLRRFLSAFCQAEHPVVLFLDDWQWADAASVAVLRHLEVNSTLRYLLVIASYRDDEVDASHPFTEAVADLRRQGIPVSELPVRDLALAEVRALLSDTLLPDAEGVAGLAEVIQSRTAGNPFFVRAMLDFMQARHELWFERSRMAWRWVAEAGDGRGGDVVQLFAMKLGLLPRACSELLSVAACLGSRFDMGTLALVAERLPEACRESLRDALEQGLIVEDSLLPPGARAEPAAGRFRFQHDRVQQAAHSLIPPDRLPVVRFRIGRLLLARLSAEQLDERLLEVTTHLNAGRSLLTDTAGQARLVLLNLAAAQRSRSAAAFHAALQFHRAGGALLAQPSLAVHFWERHHADAIQLLKNWAESEFLEGDRAQAERCIMQAVERGRTPIEQAEVLTQHIVHCTLLARYPEAIAVGRRALAALGIALPEEGFEAARDAEIARVRQWLAGRSMESLQAAPAMSDPGMLAAARVLITLGPSCYRSHQRLWSVIVPKVVNLTLEYGPVPQVGYSHTAMGGLLGWVANDYETSRWFGELARHLMTEVFCQPSDQSVFYLMMGSSLRHWFEPMSAASQDYAQAWECGLHSGNLQYAAYAFGHNMYCRYFQGTPLAELIGESRRSLDFSRTRTNQWAIDLLEGGLQVFEMLVGSRDGGLLCAAHDGEADGSLWCEADYLAQVDAHQNVQVDCIYHVLKSSALLVLGEHERALAASDKAASLIHTVGTQGLLPWPEHVFTRLLLLATLHPGASQERQVTWRAEMQSSLRQLEIWAVHGPANYHPKLLLARAEAARLEGRPTQALELYEEAAAAALGSRFHQWQGLANERAASLAESEGQGRLAQVYWQEAYGCYHLWGAGAKLRRMEAECLAAVTAAPGPGAKQAGLGLPGPGLVAHLGRHFEALRSHAAGRMAEDAGPEHAMVLEELTAATARLRKEVATRKQLEADLEHKRKQLEREVQERIDALAASRAIARQLEERNREIEAQRIHLVEASASAMNLMEDIVAARDRTEQVNRELHVSEGRLAALNQELEERVVARTEALSREIAERLQTQERLRLSELRLRDLVETIPGWVWEVDAQGRYTFAAPQCRTLLGYAPEEVVGRTPVDFFAPEDSAQQAARLRALMGQGAPIRGLENRICRRDGSPVFVETHAVPFRDAAGTVLGYRGLDHDITPRKRLEEVAREKEENFRTLFETSRDAIITVDAAGRCLDCNQAAVALFGCSDKGNLLGDGLARFTPPRQPDGQDSRDAIDKMLTLALAQGHYFWEVCHQRPDGTVFPVEVSVSVGQLNGRPVLLGIGRDVTERRRVEDELRRAKEAADVASRAKGIFLANMSHEIRTPLNAVLGFAQLMQRDASLSPIQLQRLETINRSGGHLLQLLNDILDMSRIESGRMQLVPAECEFRVLLSEVETMFHPRMEERQLGFKVQVADAVPRRLHTDAGRVRQVLLNMLGNAVKFTDHGRIDMRVTAEPGTAAASASVRLCLEVADTGVGIAPAEQEQIFELFQQTRSGRRQGSGTGLGMAISRQLARMLGGDLTVESQEGVGSTFRFTLVAAASPDAGAAPVSAPALGRVAGFRLQGAPPTVLIVDDIASNRKLLRNVLEVVGLVAHEAADGAEAVACFAAERPALVLMDLRMPGMDGLAAIRAIRNCQAGCATRILIVSADGLGTPQAEWKAAGADGFLSKPFEVQELLTRISTLLNLECVAEETSAVVAAAIPAASPGARELPRELCVLLRQATEAGNSGLLRKLVTDAVLPLHPALGRELSRLASRYDYPAILRALDEIDNHD